MKKITVSTIVLTIAIAGSFNLTAAQTGIKDLRQDTRQQIKEARHDSREDVKGLRQDALREAREARQDAREEAKEIKQGIQQNRETLKQEFEAKREEARKSLESKKEEFKNKIETRREEAKLKIETQKKELKAKLAKIKDERKKQIIERVYNQINELNKRRMDHFSAVLERLEKVLDGISGRTAKVEANGVNVAAVKTAITGATSAIAASRTAIANQAGKVYALVVNTEDSLRVDVGKIRQTLHDDLTGVQETVKTAREAVHKAATILAQIPKVNELEVATTTTQSAQ